MNMYHILIGKKEAIAPSITACPVCGDVLERSKIHLHKIPSGRGFSIMARCDRCRSYFDTVEYDPITEVSHTRTRPWGNADTGVKLSSFKTRMYLSVLKLLKDHAPAGSTILDVGCSFGGFIQQAKVQGFVPRGMDIVPESVEYNRRQGVPCDLASSVGEIDAADGSIDIIAVLDCNYYWPDQRDELRAIRRKLRSSGLLVMRLVDKSWMLTAGLAIRALFPIFGARLCRRAVNDHRVCIPLISMLRLLREEGFEIVYASTRGAMPSDKSSVIVKVSFAVGWLVWHLIGRNIAPGALVLAKKRQ